MNPSLKRIAQLTLSLVLAGLFLLLTVANLKADDPDYDLTRVTTGVNGRHSFAPSISADGTKITFHGDADLLGQGLITGQQEIWLYDTATLTVTRITTGTSDRDSQTPSVNADGTKIAFRSDADFLSQSIPDNQFEIWLYDTATMTVTRVTTGTSNRNSWNPAINADGSKVAFHSDADFFGQGIGMFENEIWLYDTATLTVTRITTGASGRSSRDPSISADGTKIAFRSSADFLGQSINQDEIWLYDTATMTVTRITTGASGRGSRGPSISADGSRIAFFSDVDFLGQGVLAEQDEIWLYDTATITVTRITTGAESDGRGNTNPVLNNDGTKIAFQSDVDFLGQGGIAEGQDEIWLYDTATMTITRVTSGTNGRSSQEPSLNNNGSKIAFESDVDFFSQGIADNQKEVWLADSENYAPVANDDSYTTTEDVPLTVSTPGVLANDTDSNGDTLSAILQTGPVSGSLSLSGNGGFVYTPTLNLNGVVTFTYLAVDGAAPAVAYWPFDEGSGTTTVDASGNGHTGTLTNGPTFSTTVPLSPTFVNTYALAFDGNDDVLDVADAVDLNTGTYPHRTVSAWFRATDVAINSRRQILWQEGATSNGLNLYLYDGAIYGGGWSSSGWSGTWLSSTLISAGQWHHVALVLNSTSTGAPTPDGLQLYLDGQLVASGSAAQLNAHSGDISAGNLSNDTKFHDGNVVGDGGHGLAGLLDELRVMNLSLSEANVQTLMTTQPGLSDTAAVTITVEAAAAQCWVEASGDTTPDYQSADASAVQAAVDAASLGDLLKIAGICAGVQGTGGLTQTVYISKNLTLRGGYTTTNWSTSNPDVTPTTLDAQSLGRVVFISDTTSAQVENLIVTGGSVSGFGLDGGGLYVGDGASLTLNNSQVVSNTANTEDGGGLVNWGRTVISGTTFSFNSAYEAGAINNLGQITITAGSIISNTATRSGGALVNLNHTYTNEPGVMIIQGSQVLSNVAGRDGGALGNDAIVYLIDSTFADNRAGKTGGVIYNSGQALTLTITNSTFFSNTAVETGGVLRQRDGTTTISGSTLNYNKAGTSGGAIRVQGGSVSVSDSTFSYNTAVQHGGALENSSLLSLNAVTVTHNSAGANGGGVESGDGGTLAITNSLIFSNSAVAYGGGVYNNATLSLSRVDILSNTVQNGDGGGVMNDSAGVATITQSALSYNQGRYGGGIENLGQISMADTSVLNNSASQDGAGIQTGGILTATRTTIAYNIADDDAGGLQNIGQATLMNSTVSHNQGLGNNHNVGGGGLYQVDDGTPPQLHLIHTTIVSNTSNNGGDGLFLIDGQAVLTNSLVAYNGAENCGAGSGSFVSGGYNLEDANTCNLTATGDITNANPLLGPLANNGGDTETHALLSGSPAIDAIPDDGSCVLSEDQRGISRPQGDRCDIGAVEQGSSTIFLPIVLKNQ